MATTEEVLRERGTKYGSFDLHAKLTTALSDVFYAHMQQYNPEGYKRITDSFREGTHMIFHKLGRAGNGDPLYLDNFVDIAGYARLVADELQKAEDFNKIEIIKNYDSVKQAGSTGRAYDNSHQ